MQAINEKSRQMVKERDDNAMDRLTAPKKKPRPPQLAERKFAPKKGALGRHRPAFLLATADSGARVQA